ncbi:MAG TPA: SprT family zinc-dependent metalloprotease [Bacteroidales bacterium]|nr:SprT family zinc-dependent metalloprotease [Bacteroidales bacterium]
MNKAGEAHNISGIDLTIIYSKRRTIGISIRQDASVIIRVPARTPMKTIERIVAGKAGWIKKHRDNYLENTSLRPGIKYCQGETHMFRGKMLSLNITRSDRPSVSFNINSIELFARNPEDRDEVKRILYRGYRQNAGQVFPVIMSEVLAELHDYHFRPSLLIIRTMKRRWGSCSMKGLITLNTELIKLADRYIEYVIIHELCHLKHHNHSKQYYEQLSELCPDWKSVRQEMKKYII